MYFVYIIRNADNKLYVGISVDPEMRVKTHNTRRGAKFTKTSPDSQLLFKEPYATMSEARRREIQIKKWRREKKELLIQRHLAGLPTKRG